MEKPVSEGVTVRELLGLEELCDVQVLAGSKGLDRRIARVTVIDVPDYGPWLQPGELVLSSGYGFHDRSKQASLIRTLFHRNVAALGIKCHGPTGKLARSVLEDADRLGLPLLDVPYELLWSVLIDAVTRCIFARSHGGGHRLSQNLEQLVQMAANRASVAELAQTAARLTRTAVVLVDRQSPSVLGPFGGEIKEDWVRRILATVPAGSSVPATDYIQAGSTAVAFHAFPVSEDSRVSGFLAAVEQDNPLAPDDLRTLEKAAELIGYAAHLARRPEAHFQDQFLQAWLAGMLNRCGSVVDQARAVGLTLAPNYYLVLMRPQLDPSSPGLARACTELRDFVTRYYLSDQHQTMLGVTSQGVVYLGQVDEHAADDWVQRRAEQDAAAMARTVQRRFPEYRVRFSIGVIAGRLEQLVDSFRTAVEALDVASAFDLPDDVVLLPNIGLYRMLYQMRDTPVMHEFLRVTLGPLVQYDQANHTELMATLEAYLASRSVGEVAGRLYTHYNTIRYRLGQIQKLLNRDLDRLADCSVLFLAVQLYRLTGGRKVAAP